MEGTVSDIGIRELKARTSEIVREVKERRRPYVITQRGRPVAMLVPVQEERVAAAPAEAEDVWRELSRLAEEVSRAWKSPKTGVEILSESRR